MLRPRRRPLTKHHVVMCAVMVAAAAAAHGRRRGGGYRQPQQQRPSGQPRPYLFGLVGFDARHESRLDEGRLHAGHQRLVPRIQLAVQPARGATQMCVRVRACACVCVCVAAAATVQATDACMRHARVHGRPCRHGSRAPVQPRQVRALRDARPLSIMCCWRGTGRHSVRAPWAKGWRPGAHAARHAPTLSCSCGVAVAVTHAIMW
jgi:hypothetical protein